ncbi:hypothetical protein TNCV_3217511 [Trichonephila clavipes]|nr:hypothetical protein TNCV_3217511 [Trichonephila clavipes]
MCNSHQRREFQHIDDFTRGMVIGLKRAGCSLSQISVNTHLDASTVCQFIQHLRIDAYADRWRSQQLLIPPFCAVRRTFLMHALIDKNRSVRSTSSGLHSWSPLRLVLNLHPRRFRLQYC